MAIELLTDPSEAQNTRKTLTLYNYNATPAYPWSNTQNNDAYGGDAARCAYSTYVGLNWVIMYLPANPTLVQTVILSMYVADSFWVPTYIRVGTSPSHAANPSCASFANGGLYNCGLSGYYFELDQYVSYYTIVCTIWIFSESYVPMFNAGFTNYVTTTNVVNTFASLVQLSPRDPCQSGYSCNGAYVASTSIAGYYPFDIIAYWSPEVKVSSMLIIASSHSELYNMNMYYTSSVMGTSGSQTAFSGLSGVSAGNSGLFTINQWIYRIEFYPCCYYQIGISGIYLLAPPYVFTCSQFSWPSLSGNTQTVYVNHPVTITGLIAINNAGGPETTATCTPTDSVTINGAAVTTPFSYSAGTLTVSPTTAAQAGTYTVSVVHTTADSATTATMTFVVTIALPDCSGFTWAQPSNKSVKIKITDTTTGLDTPTVTGAETTTTCAITTAVTVNGAAVASPFTYSAGTLTVFASSPGQIGTFTISVAHTSINPANSWTITFTINIVNLDCSGFTWAQPSDKTVKITTTDATTTGLDTPTVTGVETTTTCSITTAVTVNGAAVATPFTYSVGTFTAAPTIVAQVGIYTVSVAHTSVNVANAWTITFTVTVINLDCSGFTWAQPSDKTVKITTTDATTTGLATPTVTGVETTTTCVITTAVTVNGAAVATPFTYSAGTFTAAPTIVAQVGIYTVSVAHTSINPANAWTITFTVTVINLDCSGFTWAQPSDVTVRIKSTDATSTALDTPTTTGAETTITCVITTAVTVNAAAVATPFTFSAGTLTVAPTLSGQVGVYTVSVAHTSINPANSWTITFTVNILYMDCSQFSWSTIASNSVRVTHGPLSITGLIAVNDDGTKSETAVTCNIIDVVTVNGAAAATPFAYSAGTLTVTPTVIGQVAVYSVSIVHTTDDPNTGATITFTVEVLPQDCSQFSWPAYVDYTCRVNAGAITISNLITPVDSGLGIETIASCTIVDSYTINGAAAAVPFAYSAGTITVTPTTLAQVMAYTVVFTHTTADPNTFATITFIVNVLPMDCSKILWVNPPEFVSTWVGQGTSFQAGLEDTLVTGGTATVAQCVPVTAFSVQSYSMLNSYPIPTTLPFTYSLGVLTMNPTLPEQAGNYTVIFAHTMTFDPATLATYNMTVVVCPSTVTFVTVPVAPKDKKYTLGDRGLTVIIGAYLYEPSYCFSVTEFYFDYSPRKPTCITETLDSQKQRILGLNAADEGMYTITATLVFNDTVTVNTDVSYKLEVFAPVTETLNLISSDFDLLPKQVASLSLTVGSDFTQQITSLFNLKDQIGSVTVGAWTGGNAFLAFDPATLSFTAAAKNLDEFAGTTRVITLLLTDSSGSNYEFQVKVEVIAKIEINLGQFIFEQKLEKKEGKNTETFEVAINYDDAKYLNNENLYITKPMLKDFEKKFPWAAVGDCSVSKTGEVFCYFSRKVYIDNTIQDYNVYLQQENLNNTWLRVSIKNTETGVLTDGVPVLYNETSLVLGEANDTVTEEDPTDDSRRLRGQVTVAVDTDFGQNKNFNWTIVDYQESEMQLHLFFEDVKQISLKANDKLMINFTQTDLFMIDQEKGSSTMPGLSVYCPVPKQLSKGTVQVISGVGALMQAVLSAFALLVMFLSTFSEASMQSLFGFLRSLQLTIHVITFKVNIHSTLLMLYQALVTIVMFDFLEMIEGYSGIEFKMMTITPLNEFSEEFSLVGYKSTALFENLGTLKFMLFYFILLGSFLVIAKLALRFMNQKKTPTRKRLRKFEKNMNFLQVIVSFMMQSFFDFCMMLFIYYRVSPKADATNNFLTLPMETSGDQFAKYFSFFLSACTFIFYVYCIWFFGIKFSHLQKLYMFETLLENKPFITNIYSEVLGAEKTLFNFKLVDEKDLPRKSKILRVKKPKEPEGEQPKKEEEVFEDPIDVPESQWASRVPQETKFEASFPEFQANSILKKSLSYNVRSVQQRDAPSMDLRQFYFRSVQLSKAGKVDLSAFEAFIAEPQNKTVTFRDGLCPWRDEESDEEEFVWEDHLPEKDEEVMNWAAPLVRAANTPGLRTQVIQRRHELVQQGRGTLLFQGEYKTEPELEAMRVACEESWVFKLMKPFFQDLEFSRANTQFYFQIDITRRSSIAFAAVFFYGYVRMQMMFYIAWSYIQLLYMLVVWPFQEDRLNIMETLVEGKQYLIAFMIFFCQCGDVLKTAEEAFKMVVAVGWAGFVIELLALGINVGMAVYESTKYYILEAKKRKYRRASRKRKRERTESKQQRSEKKLLKRKELLHLIDNPHEFEDLFKNVVKLEEEKLQREEEERLRLAANDQNVVNEMTRVIAGRFYVPRELLSYQDFVVNDIAPNRIETVSNNASVRSNQKLGNMSSSQLATPLQISSGPLRTKGQRPSRRDLLEQPNELVPQIPSSQIDTMRVSRVQPGIRSNVAMSMSIVAARGHREARRKPILQPIAEEAPKQNFNQFKVPSHAPQTKSSLHELDQFILVSARHLENLGHEDDPVFDLAKVRKNQPNSGIPQSPVKDFKFYDERRHSKEQHSLLKLRSSKSIGTDCDFGSQHIVQHGWDQELSHGPNDSEHKARMKKLRPSKHQRYREE